MKSYIFIIFLLTGAFAYGHGGKKHSDGEDQQLQPRGSSRSERLAFTEINSEYTAKIKNIFKRACFDCHSNQTNLPWYYRVPGVKHMIDNDIEKAKKHLNFSGDFPFSSHDTPANDLRSIASSITNNEMPPFKYKILHLDSTLTDTDKKTILSWVNNLLEKL